MAMTDQSGGETSRGAGIGARLRDARERSGLTIEQAAQKLQLAPSIPAALEEENFGSIGAPIYVKGYLGRYAELVGESADSLQQLLAGKVIPAPDLTRIPQARAEGGRLTRRIANLGVILVIALLVIGALWWAVSRWRQHELTLRAAQTVTDGSAPKPAAAGTAMPTNGPAPSGRHAAGE